jgi:hypothetical protein
MAKQNDGNDQGCGMNAKRCSATTSRPGLVRPELMCDAKNMIHGKFLSSRQQDYEEYNAGTFPMPDPAFPMAAFQDATR